MPYRRLPNTDNARLRALKIALSEGAKTYPYDMVYPHKLHLDIQSFLLRFEQAVSQYKDSREKQAKTGRDLLKRFKVARLYLSHFIQVVNFCILRKELKQDVRLAYGMDVKNKSIPDLGTEQQLLEHGQKIIIAEEARMAKGGSRIYNPSIAMVKIKFEQFRDCYFRHKDMLVTTNKMLEVATNMRAQADALILQLWNSIEDTYKELEPDKKREAANKYGVVYIFRKKEKLRLSSNN